MCFKYCDSFPILFDLVDRTHDGDVSRLSAAETDRVLDACFQCKLCEVQCPYTPREKHEFPLDFPKLVHRWKAQRTRSDGIPLRERILADPDAAGRMARLCFGMANVMNRVKPPPRASSKRRSASTGTSCCPTSPPAPSRAGPSERGGAQLSARGLEAVLFPTCYVQNNEPEIGRDTLEVLDRNKVPTACVSGLQCCGMPAWEAGRPRSAAASRRRTTCRS